MSQEETEGELLRALNDTNTERVTLIRTKKLGEGRDSEILTQLIDIDNRTQQILMKLQRRAINSVAESSMRLESSVNNMNETGRTQSETAKKLGESSNRLEALTEAVLVFTSVLGLTAVSSLVFDVYSRLGYSAWIAFFFMAIADVIMIIVFTVSMFTINKRHKSKLKEKKD